MVDSSELIETASNLIGARMANARPHSITGGVTLHHTIFSVTA